MSADNDSSSHVDNGASGTTPAADTQPRAKINISLGGKKKKKSTVNKSASNNLLSSKNGKSSLLAEEYSTIAEEAEVISKKRKEEGTLLVIPCAQGANEDEKRKHPLLAGRLALLQQKESGDGATSTNDDNSDRTNQKSKQDGADNGEGQANINAADNDLEDEVVKQLIQSAKQTQNEQEYNGDNTTPSGRGLVISAPSKNTLITQQTNNSEINEDEQFHKELAHHASDVDPTSSVYANVAISDFGSALLRGMGWKGGDSKKSDKKTDEPIKARPHRLGLGAAPLPLPSTTSGSSKGGIHRRARRPDEVKRDEERQRQQEEAEKAAAEKKRLDVQLTLQRGSVVYIRGDNDAASQRARVVKTAGVPGLNRILVQYEGSTEDVSIAKNSVILLSWDELERRPFQVIQTSKSVDRERKSKSIDREVHQNGSSRSRKRSRSNDRNDERSYGKDTSRYSKRSERDRYGDKYDEKESSEDESRDRKRRSKKHKRKKRNHRDRSYSCSRSRSRSPDNKKRHKHESNRKSSSHKSQSSYNSDPPHLNWLIPNIRVRLISKKIPAYYLQKGVVQDVTRTSQSSPKAVLLMDNGQVIDKVPERYLETALPKAGGNIIVLEGKHHWKKARLLERSGGNGVIQFRDDLEVMNISLDCIAEWCLNDDE